MALARAFDVSAREHHAQWVTGSEQVIYDQMVGSHFVIALCGIAAGECRYIVCPVDTVRVFSFRREKAHGRHVCPSGSQKEPCAIRHAG